MEYQVFLMGLDANGNPRKYGKVLSESDHLHECISHCYKLWLENGEGVCVWQPRHGYYRDYYHPMLKSD